ncbi:MAG: Flp pilus assembly protein CpaB [Acidimicrobiales bacterium]
MTSSLTAEQETSSEAARPRPRPVAPRRRKARERISLGHLFMIAAALLAFVLVVSVLQDRSKTTEVLVARTDIQPGSAITPDQVRQVAMPAGSDLAASMAGLGDLAGGGAIAAQRIKAGDPVTLTAIAPRTDNDGLRAMSIPIERAQAVGGELAPGDRIDVISVTGSSATYVASNLEVLKTQNQQGTGALGSSALTDYYVTVAVDGQTALAIALAQQTGEVSILRSTGAPPVPAEDRVLAASPVAGPTGGSSSPADSGPTSSVPASARSTTPGTDPSNDG